MNMTPPKSNRQLLLLTLLPVGWLAIALFLSPTDAAAQRLSLESPDGKYEFSLQFENGHPHYHATHDGQAVIDSSRLGFQWASPAGQPKIGPPIKSSLSVSQTSTHRHTWKPLYGERSIIVDHYNTRTYSWQRQGGLKIDLEVRCYDEGIAFCYHFTPTESDPPKRKFEIQSERTEFTFSANYITWATKTAQGEYQRTTINELTDVYDRPQIFQHPTNPLFVAVGEARLVDFARMQLTASKEKQHCVRAKLSGKVNFQGQFKSPWRFVMAAGSPGRLVENNDIVLNLSDPCAIKDTSWIQPGKVLREVTLTSEGAYACIDYAAEHGMKYILIDAGWYGNEFEKSSDATTVTIDRSRSNGEIDMAGVIAHGKKKGIGIILYVNRRALEKQLDEILPLYKKWGVAGVKYGFVNVGSQHWTRWLHEAIRKAADHQLMIDIHDEYRPTGYSRTYPHLMTQEGIGGDETSPTPKKTLGILFPRSIAGAADHTFCYYSVRVDELANHAYQLGKTVCFYSPWQVLFWYDRPPASPRKEGGAGGGDGVIGNEPELEFFDALPTVWNETKFLEGEIEQYAVVARRSNDDWFIGAINADTPHQLGVKLDFLTPGKTYLLRSYTHDPSAPTATKVKTERRTVTAESTLNIQLQRNDGSAYHLSPTQ